MHKYNSDIMPEDMFSVQDKPLHRYSTDIILPEDVELFPVLEEHKSSAVNSEGQALIPTAIKLTRTLGNQTSRSRISPKYGVITMTPFATKQIWGV